MAGSKVPRPLVMEVILEELDRGVCRHCETPIVLFTDGWRPARWFHDLDNGGQIQCPGAPVAEPKES